MREIVKPWRGVLRGLGTLVAAAALLPTAAGAAQPASARAATKPVPPAGLFAHTGAPLAGRFSHAGDMIAAGWALSMPENHPATTVALSGMTATIPFLCLTWTSHTVRSLVIALPDTSITIPAGDTGWHPTSSSISASGYQAVAALPGLCENGLSVPEGNIAYTAKVVSTDTGNLFAMRFHAVDGRTAPHDEDTHPDSDSGRRTSRDDGETKNTNCASATQNHGARQCYAAWTGLTENTAAAPALTVGGTGGGPGSGSGAGGTGTRPPVVAPRPTNRGAAAPSPAQLGAVTAPAVAPIPVLVLPAPSGPTVLGPVPLMIPVIATGGSPAGTALPWNWFVLLAVVDLALIVGIVLRRRRGHDDQPSAQ